MSTTTLKRPLVPGSLTIPGYGSGHGNGRARGAKNPRVTKSCHHRIDLVTYSGRTLRTDDRVAELEVELGKIHWHILGLSEVRREGEDTMTLESGNLLYFREDDHLSQGGVGFLVNKVLVNNVVEIGSVSNRVAYLVLKLTKRYSLKVVQVYAPTSTHSDTEVEAIYEDISRAVNDIAKTQFTVVMGDFNAKVGVQERDESKPGPHGYGSRNHRGQMLVNFLESQGLYLMNSFFKKQPRRKWTWRSPDGKTKNEIDFIMTNKRHIFRDVSVINRFNTGSTDFYLTRRRKCTYFACQKEVKMTVLYAAARRFIQSAFDRFCLRTSSDNQKMTVCSVLCCKNRTGKAGQNNIHVSYHKFPSNPNIKIKWMEATGQRNWFPTRNSRICSTHFDNSCFTEGKKFRRLLPEAVPTIDVLQTNKIEVISEDALPITNTSRKRKLEQDIKQPSTSNEQTPLNTPKKKKILHKLNQAQHKIKQQNKQIKKLREQNRRKGLKILTLVALLECLKKKSFLNDEQANLLNSSNVTTKELYSRQMKNANVVSTAKYSPALRSFALTLHYYSSKAYNYVRKVFNLCLPHPHTIEKWFKCIDGRPGFTTESLNALKLIANKSKNPLYCCLMIDEMAIKKKIEWDGKKFHGYVDFGGGLDSDEVPEAKEALVFLVTGINANWKVPVGYFLIDGANGQQKADLVIQCLKHLNESNIIVVGLTFDGCPSNLTMAKKLGCRLNPNEELKTTFEHPITKQPIAVFLDACHMVKLVRNCLQSYANIIDGNGKCVSWAYLELLHKLQSTEYFHLGNKLRNSHVKFQNQKMKVKLATQLLSESVAKSLDFCRETLNIPDFEGLLATAEFIRIFNNLFDVLNSRNLKKFGFKQPLNMNNKTRIMEFLDQAENYIRGLRTTQGDLLIKSSRKTGFVGLLVCIKSTKVLFQQLIEEEKIKFMSMYRFSQDHLELFFCNVRAHGGCNNNPTSRQFQSFYKKMLNHVEIKHCNDGNCVELEQISVLNCSSAVQTINSTTTGATLADDEIDITEFNFSSICDFDTFCSKLPELTEFSEQIITYIAGYVVRALGKVIKCDECCSALSSPKANNSHAFEFIVFKDKGGLVYPSKDVTQICKVAELEIRQIIDTSQKFSKKPSSSKLLLINKILRVFVNSNIFSSIAIHQFDQPPTENHLVQLIKAVANIYIDVRFHYLTKHIKTAVTKRQLYNKLILFQGQ